MALQKGTCSLLPKDYDDRIRSAIADIYVFFLSIIMPLPALCWWANNNNNNDNNLINNTVTMTNKNNDNEDEPKTDNFYYFN